MTESITKSLQSADMLLSVHLLLSDLRAAYKAACLADDRAMVIVLRGLIENAVKINQTLNELA